MLRIAMESVRFIFPVTERNIVSRYRIPIPRCLCNREETKGSHIQGKSIVSLSKLTECFTLFRNPRFEYSALVSINCLVRYCTLCLLCYSEIFRTNVWRNILMLLFLSCREIAAFSCWMNFREHWEISRSFLSFSVKGTFLFSILCCRNT